MDSLQETSDDDPEETPESELKNELGGLVYIGMQEKVFGIPRSKTTYTLPRPQDDDASDNSELA